MSANHRLLGRETGEGGVWLKAGAQGSCAWRASDDSMNQSSGGQMRRESLTSLLRIVIARDNESAYRLIQRLRAARLGLAAVLDEKKIFEGSLPLRI